MTPSRLCLTAPCVSLAMIYFAITTTGCTNSQSGPAKPGTANNHPPQVVAVSQPLRYLAQRLLPDSIDVQLCGENVTPNWQPSADQIAAMQSADLIVVNGNAAPYAKWLVTTSLPESKLVQTANKGLSLRDYIQVEDVRMVHSHGPEGEHSHPTMVARSWLSPAIAAKQATYLAQRLQQAYPEHATAIADNLKTLDAELSDLSSSLSKFKEETKVAKVFSSDIELKFFARATGVEEDHFLWESNVTAEQCLNDLKEKLQTDSEPSSASSAGDRDSEFPVSILLVPVVDQSWLTDDLVNQLKQHNCHVVRIDMLDQQSDYVSGMKQNIENLLSTLTSSPQ